MQRYHLDKALQTQLAKVDRALERFSRTRKLNHFNAALMHLTRAQVEVGTKLNQIMAAEQERLLKVLGESETVRRGGAGGTYTTG
jgi:hypothetical protein